MPEEEKLVKSLAPSSSFLSIATFFSLLNPSRCERPTLIFSPAQQQLSDKEQQELSAEKFYQKQGFSLEQALHKILGEIYQKSNDSDKSRWRNFLVAFVNGNMDKTISEQFTEFAQLSSPRHQAARKKSLNNLLVAHEAIQRPLPATPLGLTR